MIKDTCFQCKEKLKLTNGKCRNCGLAQTYLSQNLIGSIVAPFLSWIAVDEILDIKDKKEAKERKKTLRTLFRTHWIYYSFAKNANAPLLGLSKQELESKECRKCGYAVTNQIYCESCGIIWPRLILDTTSLCFLIYGLCSFPFIIIKNFIFYVHNPQSIRGLSRFEQLMINLRIYDLKSILIPKIYVFNRVIEPTQSWSAQTWTMIFWTMLGICLSTLITTVMICIFTKLVLENRLKKADKCDEEIKFNSTESDDWIGDLEEFVNRENYSKIETIRLYIKTIASLYHSYLYVTRHLVKIIMGSFLILPILGLMIGSISTWVFHPVNVISFAAYIISFSLTITITLTAYILLKIFLLEKREKTSIQS